MTLQASDTSLVERYDVALLDLDGVVYLGRDPVPEAAPALAKARAAGMRLAFVTNNASRSPQEVAALLHDLGVEADAGEIVTSAQAAARVLAERLRPGDRVLVVGSDALRHEVSARGLTVVGSAEDDPQAVVQGYAPTVGWPQLAEATVAVRRGAFWLATNTDLTVPSPRGALPGNGAMVSTVVQASGLSPMVAGKPEPALHEESVRRTGARHPVVVGDRLDTDIEGANRAGAASLLVLSGVTTATDLLAAHNLHRPTYVAADVGGLLYAHPGPSSAQDGWECRGWCAQVTAGGDLVLSGSGPDRLDALRAMCAARWDSEGTGDVRAKGAPAAEALRRLGLTSAP